MIFSQREECAASVNPPLVRGGIDVALCNFNDARGLLLQQLACRLVGRRVGKSPKDLFAEFEGTAGGDTSSLGDVKYRDYTMRWGQANAWQLKADGNAASCIAPTRKDYLARPIRRAV